jgi:hypothetical protein
LESQLPDFYDSLIFEAEKRGKQENGFFRPSSRVWTSSFPPKTLTPNVIFTPQNARFRPFLSTLKLA